MTTTIDHTIPSGETVTFRVDANISSVTGAVTATVSYPSIDEGGPDLSAYSSDAAYPVAAIEAAVSEATGKRVVFAECTATGSDDGAYETWRFRAAGVVYG